MNAQCPLDMFRISGKHLSYRAIDPSINTHNEPCPCMDTRKESSPEHKRTPTHQSMLESPTSESAANIPPGRNPLYPQQPQHHPSTPSPPITTSPTASPTLHLRPTPKGEQVDQSSCLTKLRKPPKETTSDQRDGKPRRRSPPHMSHTPDPTTRNAPKNTKRLPHPRTPLTRCQAIRDRKGGEQCKGTMDQIREDAMAGTMREVRGKG